MDTGLLAVVTKLTECGMVDDPAIQIYSIQSCNKFMYRTQSGPGLRATSKLQAKQWIVVFGVLILNHDRSIN